MESEEIKLMIIIVVLTIPLILGVYNLILFNKVRKEIEETCKEIRDKIDEIMPPLR